MPQAQSSIFMARFMTLSKNGSRNMLNHSIWRRSNFETARVLSFPCLIRKVTNLGTLDLESSQKGLSSDIHIFQFEPYPICTKNPPHIFKALCSKPLCTVTCAVVTREYCNNMVVLPV